MGEVVKKRHKEIFLSTKVEAREPAEALKQIELSLKRLQTDRLDMLKIHGEDSLVLRHVTRSNQEQTMYKDTLSSAKTEGRV